MRMGGSVQVEIHSLLGAARFGLRFIEKATHSEFSGYITSQHALEDMRRRHALWDLERHNNRNTKFLYPQHPGDTAPENSSPDGTAMVVSYHQSIADNYS